MRSGAEAAKSTTKLSHSRGATVMEAMAHAWPCQRRGIPTIQRHSRGKQLTLHGTKPGLAVRVVGTTDAVGPAVIGGRRAGRAVGAERGAIVMVLLRSRSCAFQTIAVNYTPQSRLPRWPSRL